MKDVAADISLANEHTLIPLGEDDMGDNAPGDDIRPKKPKQKTVST